MQDLDFAVASRFAAFEHRLKRTTKQHFKVRTLSVAFPQLCGMANELKMEVKQAVLGLARQGFSQRRIARELGVHRKSVKRLLEERSGSEGSMRATVMTGNRAPTPSMCDPFRDAIEAKLVIGGD